MCRNAVRMPPESPSGYAGIRTLLKKPALYERTMEKLWNDLHISKGMLETHLNPEIDAASRKHEFINRSAAWILSLLPFGAYLLDIGCGPGLYTKRFAECGLRVTGMDFSERSIAYAREHDLKSEYVLLDYHQMDYYDAFDMITLIWCDYGALIPEERINLLQRVYRALKPGGLFLFDIFTPVYNAKLHESTSWEVYEQGGFWSPEPHVCLNAEYRYGDNIMLRRTVIIEGSADRCYNIWDTCFTKESLLNEALPIGFSCDGFYSDVAGKPYTDESETMCAIMKK